MPIGNRAFLKIDRPDKEQVEKFQNVPIANLADIMGRMSCVDSKIKNYGKKRTMLGTAFTVKCPYGDNLFLHLALDLFEPGDVLVVDGQACEERSLYGEIMSSYSYKRGCAGAVIDGALRDAAGLAKLDMAVYGRSIQANGPYKNGPGEINVPVSVGGIVVYPGDIIIGDEDGVIAIRPKEAEELYEKVSTFNAKEEGIIHGIMTEGKWNRKMFEDAFTATGIEKIDAQWNDK